ncbi:MAG: immunity 17 family protein [Ruminococcus sp.]|nr:immunity 17 family protein [Ruminococcus sp.]
MSNAVAGLLVVLVAVFCFFCAYKDYDWFMENRKARLFVGLFGRDGARKFYMGLGVVLGVLGVVVMFIPGNLS